MPDTTWACTDCGALYPTRPKANRCCDDGSRKAYPWEVIDE